MSENPQDVSNVVRQQSFDVEGPVELDLGTGAGRLEVRLVDEPGVHVEVRHDASGANPFTQGLSSLMNFLGSQMGNDVVGGGDPAATALTVDCVGINDVLERALARTGTVDLVKLDIEGLEIDTVRAMDPALLRRVREVVFEAFDVAPDAPLHPALFRERLRGSVYRMTRRDA